MAAQEAERERQALGATQGRARQGRAPAARGVPVAGGRGAAQPTAARSSISPRPRSTGCKTNRGADGRAHKAIDTLVQPIADTLKRSSRLGEAERTRIDSYARLTEQVAALGSTTHTLSRALRTPAVRGRWGEMQLRRVVEIAGMLQRCDFDEQPALLVRQRPPAARPDRPPAGRQADRRRRQGAARGVPRRAGDAPTTRRAPSRLQAHARQVRDHMDKLGSKALLGAARRLARDGGDVPARRDALQRGAAARPDAHRARAAAAGAAGQPDHADRAADHRGPHLAAGGAGRELPRGGAAGQGVLRAAGDVRRPLRRRAARSSTARCRPTTRRPGRSRSRVLVSARRLRDLDVTTAAETAAGRADRHGARAC